MKPGPSWRLCSWSPRWTSSAWSRPFAGARSPSRAALGKVPPGQEPSQTGSEIGPQPSAAALLPGPRGGTELRGGDEQRLSRPKRSQSWRAARGEG
eukprot:872916-Alexandrium_andersonii.AAC.1